MVEAVFSVAPRQSLVSHVERELRVALIEGRLEPGRRLVTKDLAATLGMSITPVREALVRMAAAGVLTAEPSQAFRVPILTAEQYAELIEIRLAVEGLAAAKAAPRIGTAALARMASLLDDYLLAKTSGDPHRALAVNKAFRFVLYESAAMPALLSVIETLWLRAGPGFHYAYPQEERVFVEHRNYQELLAALHLGSAGRARRAIEAAIRDGAAQVIGTLGRPG